MLEIVKKLRVHRFAVDMTLKQRQQKLVSFFDEYRLSGPKSKDQQEVEKKNKAKNRRANNRKTERLGVPTAAPLNLED